MAVGKGLTATFNSVSVGKVIDISIGGCVVATTDSSHQGLTADTNGVCWREHESSGFAEPGDVSIKCLFDGVLPALGTTASLVIGWGSVLNKQWTFALASIPALIRSETWDKSRLLA